MLRSACSVRSTLGPPESLSNCTLLNQTAESVHVSCQAHSDGGLKQRFRIQAVDVTSGSILSEATSDVAADFWIDNLEPGTTFVLYLFAYNAKGSSSSVVIPVSTIKEAAKQTIPGPVDPGPVDAAAAAAGSQLVAGVAVALAATAAFLLTCAALVAASWIQRKNYLLRRTQAESGGLTETDHANNVAATSAGLTNKAHWPSQSVKQDPVDADDGDDDDGDDADSCFFHRPVRISSPSYSDRADNNKVVLKVFTAPNYYLCDSDVPESCV